MEQFFDFMTGKAIPIILAVVGIILLWFIYYKVSCIVEMKKKEYQRMLEDENENDKEYP